MPVVTKPSPELAGKYSGEKIDQDEPTLPLVRQTLDGCESPYKDDPRKPPTARPALLSSSLDDWQYKTPIIPFGNGLVNGIVNAFGQDLHLVLRPDDVWLSVLTQFSMFVNGNAEHLRHLFVSHEGKMNISVDVTPFPLSKLDMGRLAQEMTSVIQENVVDPELKAWMIPKFSTTTDTDLSVASFVMMGSLERYFSYSFLCGCGFPSVTLLGQKSDWEEIQRRVQRLPKYGAEPAEWSQLLLPVIKYMIKTFDEPDSSEVKDFWLRVCHTAGPEASGIQTLSGWITAFCFWAEDGKRIHGYSDDSLSGKWGTPLETRKRLLLDGVVYPLISPKNIPKGVVTLPVTIVDTDAGVNRHTTVLAGSVGMTLTARETTVQPLSGWWMIEVYKEKIDVLQYPAAGVSKTGSTTDGTSETNSAGYQGF